MRLRCAIGPVTFSLAACWRAEFDASRARPFLTLPTGEVVSSLRLGGANYLVVDHRRAGYSLARVEFWAPEQRCEGDLAGLFVLAEAVPAGEVSSRAAAADTIGE